MPFSEYRTDGSTWITEQKKAGCDQGLDQGSLTLMADSSADGG